MAGMIFDQKGNLYGTTIWGGAYGEGAVFKLTLKGKETVLSSFDGQDGAWPEAGLAFDQAGNLYGTTYYGGVTTIYNPGYGVVFKLTP